MLGQKPPWPGSPGPELRCLERWAAERYGGKKHERGGPRRGATMSGKNIEKQTCVVEALE